MTSEAGNSAIPVATPTLARKFGVADAMILVVGLSLAMAAGSSSLCFWVRCPFIVPDNLGL